MTDPVPAVTAAVAAVSLAATWWYARGRRPHRIALEAAPLIFTAFIGIVLSAAQLCGLVQARLTGEWAHEYSHRIPPGVFWVAGFPVDLRFCFAATFAVVILLQTVRCLRAARALLRCEPRSRTEGLRALLCLLALSVTVLPWIHLARPVAGGSVLGSIALLAGRRRASFKVRPGRLVATVSAGR